MRKFIIALSLLAFCFAADFNARENSFFGVYGKQAAVMGRVDGSSMEFWVYPYKIAHRFRFLVSEGGREISPYPYLSSFSITPEVFTRKFVHQDWVIKETAFSSLEHPLIYLVYEINAIKPLELVFTFHPDLLPMWPGCIGGKFSYWDKRGGYVIAEGSWKTFALLGFPPSGRGLKLPAHSLPGEDLKYVTHLDAGKHTLVIPITAGNMKPEMLFKRIKRTSWEEALKERKTKIQSLRQSLLQVEAQDPRFTKAMRWAVLNLHLALVKNPLVGEGLVAGYGLSGEGQRPGFAWFFGGDGSINSMAALDAGDFALVKQEIKFLFKYQRKDGKIPHEISQGMSPSQWFSKYGFGFFHGDTTLYFVVLLGDYLKRTGDLRFIRKYAGKIYRAMSWMLYADQDDDGLVESEKAGVGAAEVGPMRQKMKTDILLAGLSVRAWESLAYIWKALKFRRNAVVSSKFAKKARENFERLFWDEENSFYFYGLKDPKHSIKELSAWPSVPMSMGCVEEKHGTMAARTLASPWLSTDWGVRFLASLSNFYDPTSYNNGAVWPFLTGFSSLALYNYANPYHGFSLLQASMNIILDGDYGAGTEVLNGDLYAPLEESVPNQIWSSATPIMAFVRGLLGFSPNVPARRIILKPSIPLYWRFLKVKNLRVGGGSLDLTYRRTGWKVEITLDLHGLKGYSVEVRPEIAGEMTNQEGKKVKSFSFPALSSDKESLKVKFTVSNFLFPFVRVKPRPGSAPSAPIISFLKKDGQKFILGVWGKGKATVFVLTDRKLQCPGARLEKIRTIYRVALSFPDRWELKELGCSLR